jgi:hypothetical protein
MWLSHLTIALLSVTGLMDTGSPRLSEATTVGVHNTYDKGAYTYLADALDAGAGLIELDAWFNIFTHKWNLWKLEAWACGWGGCHAP